RALVGSSTSLDMWRAHSVLDKNAGNDQVLGAAAPNTAPADQCPADKPPPQAPAPNPKPAPATDSGAKPTTPGAPTAKRPKPTAPRTIAQLTAFRPNSSTVVLGENQLSNGQVSSLVLEHLHLEHKMPVQLIRRDLSGYPRGIKFEDNRKSENSQDTRRKDKT